MKTTKQTFYDYLEKHPNGTISVRLRKRGSKGAYRLAEIYTHNHQDIWVWISDSKGNLRTNARVEHRIDRQKPYQAALYEVI